MHFNTSLCTKKFNMLYLVTDKGERRVYGSLKKVGADYGVSVYTLRRSRRVAKESGLVWRYLIGGVVLIEDCELVEEKSGRGGFRVKK